jgi:hypothetical protein
MSSHVLLLLLNPTIFSDLFHLKFYLYFVHLAYIKVFRPVNDKLIKTSNKNERNSHIKMNIIWYRERAVA